MYPESFSVNTCSQFELTVSLAVLLGFLDESTDLQQGTDSSQYTTPSVPSEVATADDHARKCFIAISADHHPPHAAECLRTPASASRRSIPSRRPRCTWAVGPPTALATLCDRRYVRERRRSIGDPEDVCLVDGSSTLSMGPMNSDRFGGSVGRAGRNAGLCWLVVALLVGLTIRQGVVGSYRWFSLAGIAVVLVVLPAAARRDPYAMPPWGLLVLVAIPVVDAAILGETVVSPVAVYLAVAAVALIVAVDVHAFTPVRMNRAFTVALVVIATLAVGAAWNVAQWVSDAALGTGYLVGDRTQDAANRAMMIDFLYATIAGSVAGVLFAGYLRRRSFAPTASTPLPREAPEEREEEPDPTPSLVRGRLGVSEERIGRFVWAIQLVLVGLLVYGIVVRDVTTITNAAIALAVTFLPALLERNYRFPIEPELVVWLTAAAFLHTLGSAGLYDHLGQWDSLTHALSASLVAATGYTVVRAIDLHSDDVYLPSRTMFAFILLFVLAVGVVWELVEFALDLAAQRFEFDAVLAQHGIDDTVGDLLFNLAGAVVAATLGATYLTDVSHRFVDRLGDRRG
jgi:hypothetical protein